MPPGQPIQAPSLARITGSRAVTRPPGERAPAGAAVGVDHPVDGQPVGDDDEVGGRSGHARPYLAAGSRASPAGGDRRAVGVVATPIWRADRRPSAASARASASGGTSGLSAQPGAQAARAPRPPRCRSRAPITGSAPSMPLGGSAVAAGVQHDVRRVVEVGRAVEAAAVGGDRGGARGLARSSRRSARPARRSAYRAGDRDVEVDAASRRGAATAAARPARRASGGRT